jgi:hypothetical protein
MIIKKFESFIGDKPYININYGEFLEETNKREPFENIELLRIIKGLRANSNIKLFYSKDDIFDKYIGYTLTRKDVDQKLRLDRKVSKISFYKKRYIDIIKGQDNYIYLNDDVELYKCDDLGGLLELLKHLEIWKEPKS